MPLITQTYSTVPGGMIRAIPSHELEDDQAFTLVDGLVDQPGLVRRRGPVQASAGIYAPTARILGITNTFDPAGTHRIAILKDITAGNEVIEFLTTDFTSNAGTFDLGAEVGGVSPYPIFDSKPMVDKGTVIGVSTGYGLGATQALAMWRGGVLSNHTTGSLQAVARGDTVINFNGTPALLTNAIPGMFLFRTQGGVKELLGVAETINSDTQITLEQGSLVTASNLDTYQLQSLRGIVPRVAEGAITTNTASTTVLGTQTKFRDQGLATGTWDVYRESDMTYAGTVTSVQSNSELTFTANAAIAMNLEDYVAIRRDGDYDPKDSTLGFINSTFAGRQFYANKGTVNSEGADLTRRIWISDNRDPEQVDMTEDGTNITISSEDGSSPAIRGLVSTQNALIIFKEDETHALFGTSLDDFITRRLLNDGLLGLGAAMSYGPGVIWPGRHGIYYWDGLEITNLMEGTLGDYYLQLVSRYNPDSARMAAMVARDHYILFMDALSNNVTITKNATNTNFTAITLVINMRTGTVVMFTPNVSVRGHIRLPGSEAENVWYIVNTSTEGRICEADDLFDDTAGNDVLDTDAGSLGPDFYMETKKYSMGDDQLKKLFKQVQMLYIATVTGGTDDVTDALRLDTVPSLNTTGTLSSSRFSQQTNFTNKRIKFLKRSQHFSFRLYQESSSVTRIVLGPWAIGFKPMREGRP